MTDVLNDSLTLGEAVLAVGALGTAAYGIIDVTKSFWGGVSRVGYQHIVNTLTPFAPALDAAAGPARWRELLFCHWLNGRPVDEQKSTAKALVRLGLSATTAPLVAKAGHVDPKALEDVAAKLGDGEPLDDRDLNVLGRFDAALDMELEAAFDRADQQYRSNAKMLAAFTAIALAMIAAAMLGLTKPTDFALAALVGVLAVPLAPVAKDLASGLSAAVKAVQASRKV
jgi:hypothetical protein